jgi:hypothetical protein
MSIVERRSCSGQLPSFDHESGDGERQDPISAELVVEMFEDREMRVHAEAAHDPGDHSEEVDQSSHVMKGLVARPFLAFDYLEAESTQYCNRRLKRLSLGASVLPNAAMRSARLPLATCWVKNVPPALKVRLVSPTFRWP